MFLKQEVGKVFFYTISNDLLLSRHSWFKHVQCYQVNFLSSYMWPRSNFFPSKWTPCTIIFMSPSNRAHCPLHHILLKLGMKKWTRHHEVSDRSQGKMAHDRTLSKISHVHIYMYRTGKCKKSQIWCFSYSLFYLLSWKVKGPDFFGGVGCLSNVQMILIYCPSLTFLFFPPFFFPFFHFF